MSDIYKDTASVHNFDYRALPTINIKVQAISDINLYYFDMMALPVDFFKETVPAEKLIVLNVVNTFTRNIEVFNHPYNIVYIYKKEGTNNIQWSDVYLVKDLKDNQVITMNKNPKNIHLPSNIYTYYGMIMLINRLHPFYITKYAGTHINKYLVYNMVINKQLYKPIDNKSLLSIIEDLYTDPHEKNGIRSAVFNIRDYLNYLVRNTNNPCLIEDYTADEIIIEKSAKTTKKPWILI